MYSQKLLNLEIRNAIYNFILKNPGIHFRKIARKNKIPLTTLGYHIRLLKKHDFVKEKSENGYTRYYALKDLKEQDKKILSLFRQDAPRTIILLLGLYAELSQVEIIRLVNRWKNHPSKIGVYLNKHQTTLSYHLNKLIGMDVIESIPNGNETKYLLKHPEQIYEFITKYRNFILNDTTNRIIKYMEDPKLNIVDSITDNIFEIFPHPYYG